ncbi:MAG TPA: DUF3237 domain-containing protein [Dehalococcoidia bacterium]|nr:DUF3237 domain-containing protein [Dehalococcoidia bacterium]
MDTIPSEFLMDYRIELVGSGYGLGTTPTGDRRTGGISGGSFEGPRLKGKVEPFGDDWMIARPDDALDPEVRTVLTTDDGVHIGLKYGGIIYPGSKLAYGEDIYWRIVMRFYTGSEKYDWLNRIIAIGAGKMEPGVAVYRVWEVK